MRKLERLSTPALKSSSLASALWAPPLTSSQSPLTCSHQRIWRDNNLKKKKCMLKNLFKVEPDSLTNVETMWKVQNLTFSRAPDIYLTFLLPTKRLIITLQKWFSSSFYHFTHISKGLHQELLLKLIKIIWTIPLSNLYIKCTTSAHLG